MDLERVRKFIHTCIVHTSTNAWLNVYYNRLLDVLAGRKAKKNLSGHVLINDRRQPINFKCASAYVVQVNMTVVHAHVYNIMCMHML